MSPASSTRGGAWVAGQVAVLGLLAVIAPATARDEPSFALRAASVAIALCGSWISLWAALRLGRSLTPFPKPVAEGRFTRAGPYRWVRHPIYAGVLLVALGWELWWQSAFGAMLLPVVFAFFALKARAEERWLAAAYPEYTAYAKQVKALIPFLY